MVDTLWFLFFSSMLYRYDAINEYSICRRRLIICWSLKTVFFSSFICWIIRMNSIRLFSLTRLQSLLLEAAQLRKDPSVSNANQQSWSINSKFSLGKYIKIDELKTVAILKIAKIKIWKALNECHITCLSLILHQLHDFKPVKWWVSLVIALDFSFSTNESGCRAQEKKD